MIGRRPFIVASLLAGASAAAAPLIGGCDAFRPSARPAGGWDPDAIPDLDLHFDATRLDVSPIDSTDFVHPGRIKPATSLAGREWSNTGNMAMGPEGLRMVGGGEATTLTGAIPLSHTTIRFTVTPGRERASLGFVLEANDSRRCEVILRRTAEIDSAELKGLCWGAARRYQSQSNLELGARNVIEIRIQPGRLEISVNHVPLAAATLGGGWTIRRYGVGFRDNDTASAVTSLVVSDSAPHHLRDGDRVAHLPQLAQPNPCLSADQLPGSKTPVLDKMAIGSRQALQFDGAQSLATGAAMDLASVTIVAVVKQRPSGGGTIVGPNESTGGLQLRIDSDGSVVALNAGRAGLLRSEPSAVGDSPSIVAFSLDSVGNARLYVNGRPAGGAVSPVAFPAGVTMSVGAAYNAEFFNGSIGEVLRWRRPLTGRELRTVFTALSTKWGIPVAGVIGGQPTAPLRTHSLKGSNIIPSLADLENDNPAASAWLNLWSRWDWHWIELSVRRAVDQGANTIRLIGDVNAVHSRAISETTYHDRLQQVIDLCKSVGCRFYYCAIDLRHKRDADPGFITSFLGGVAAVLARNNNVLAIELCNEVASAYQMYPEKDVVGWMSTWAGAIRAAAPSIPLSISDVSPGPLSDKICRTDYYEQYVHFVDFFDLHAYEGLEIATDSAVLAPYELSVDRPLLIGEFGIDRKVANDVEPAEFYSRVKAMRDSSPLVVGALQWGAVNDDWGLYSETTGALQTDIASEWGKF